MIGTTIQNYQVSSLLGEGGMGKVYLATDTLLGRTVAIKNLNVNLTNQPQFLERFKNEAKTPSTSFASQYCIVIQLFAKG
ncbi:MAG: hypothetical protein IPH58_05865 [Sphingobacteriales bacterium]|nr:hypothetical protein [Sphingobacteriales bacterium]